MAAHIDTVHWYSPSVHPEKITKRGHRGLNPRPPACEADILTNRTTASSAMTAAVKTVPLYYLLSCIPTSTGTSIRTSIRTSIPSYPVLCLCFIRPGRHPKFSVFKNSGGRI